MTYPLNTQWSHTTGLWTVDCPMCGHKEAMTWNEQDAYTCPGCGRDFTNDQIFSYMTIADYFNHPRTRNECMRHAQEGYKQDGRGVVIFDCRQWPGAPQTYYLPKAKVEETIGWPNDKVASWVRDYDPMKEVFVYIMNNDGSLDDWQRLWIGFAGKG